MVGETANPRGPSEREQLIIQRVAEGCKNREIADSIGTTEHVVKNYLRVIYDKLGLWKPRRAGAVVRSAAARARLSRLRTPSVRRDAESEVGGDSPARVVGSNGCLLSCRNGVCRVSSQERRGDASLNRRKLVRNRISGECNCQAVEGAATQTSSCALGRPRETRRQASGSSSAPSRRRLRFMRMESEIR